MASSTRAAHGIADSKCPQHLNKDGTPKYIKGAEWFKHGPDIQKMSNEKSSDLTDEQKKEIGKALRDLYIDIFGNKKLRSEKDK
jgi:hypothetical protein